MSDLNLTFTNLSQLSRAYGTPAVDMAGRVLQQEALGSLGIAGVGLIASAGFGLTLLACHLKKRAAQKAADQAYKQACEAHEKAKIEYVKNGGAYPSYPNRLYDFDSGIASVILGSASLALGVLSLIGLLDIWAWTALTDPQLALAHRIFGSMGG